MEVRKGVFEQGAVTSGGVNEVVYLDGAPIGYTPFVQVGYATSYQYQIGAGFTTGWPAGNGSYFYFQGLIDEVEFFNRALWSAELQSTLHSDWSGICRLLLPGTTDPRPSALLHWNTSTGPAHDSL